MSSLVIASNYEILKMIECRNTVSIRKFDGAYQIQVVIRGRVVRRRLAYTTLNLYGEGWVPASHVRWWWNGKREETMVERYTRLADRIRAQHYADTWEIKIRSYIDLPQSLVGIVRGYLW
jgi:hypothetical protein